MVLQSTNDRQYLTLSLPHTDPNYLLNPFTFKEIHEIS